jgi:uncharacterized protein (TIGR03083 family)
MVLDALRSERLLLVDRLRALTPSEWEVETLCTGWSVRHVVAHLCTPFLVSTPAMGLLITRHRSVARAMDAAARRIAAERSREDLLRLLEERAESTFRPPGLPLSAPLTDAVAHSADIRWAVGDAIEDWARPDRLRPVLEFLVGPRAAVAFVPPGRLRGVRLVATDQDWAHGRGKVLEGPSLLLAMAVLGRRPALDGVQGDGQQLLAARC